MAKDLLLEIGVEEIPSAYMTEALANLKENAVLKLSQARLNYQSINCFGTARRLALIVNGLDEGQSDAVIENRGPKKSVAFDAEGNASKAGLGFARGQGVEFKELEIREHAGLEYMYAVKKEKGAPTEEVLPEILKEIIQSLSFPRSMRWGIYQFRFARPIRWLTVVYEDQLVELKIENVVSGMYTMGHRFLSSGRLEIKNLADYREKLQENYVVLNQLERKDMISRQIKAVAATGGGEAMENDALLNEVTYLVEYPTAFHGHFDPDYLEVPPEVLTTSMIEHQRYFPIFNKEGKLLPGFIGISNGTADNIDTVRAGNERVLKARLEDALFFWREDLKKDWDQIAGQLDAVLFHERLGTVGEKVIRLQKNAVSIAGQIGGIDIAAVERAAFLCKTDLLSSMVYEFPELQGIMGRYYALEAGETPAVSDAIYEHYLPRFAGDELPTSLVGIALSLAEKIDHLTGFFALDIKPSGSQDPYALRRQAMGIATIMLDKQPDIDLEKTIGDAYDNLTGVELVHSRDEVIGEVLDFIRQRLRGILTERGYSYDVIDAVFALQGIDIADIEMRVKAVTEFKNLPGAEDFMVVYNRAHNLSKSWESDEINKDLLQEDTEIELLQAVEKVSPLVKDSIKQFDYTEALMQIIDLRPHVDAFFDQVMVMSPDPEIKALRLGLLKKIADLCKLIADFSKIV
ncbi:MAG: glycine--tRNA ligase subunit beta [Syntrophomonadaceae bacterium]|nr:glycine--tRNA ligase subunit beta [Syntrophomonadaceae bacterium]